MDTTAPINWLITKAMAPEIIWARYADAFGLDALKETFGEHWPPERARHGETLWTWRDSALPRRAFDTKDHPAAWLSLMPDQFDPRQVHMSRGVWPEWHGRGLGRAMRDYAEAWCRERGAVSLYIEVRAKNEQHLASVMGDTYWVERGVFYHHSAPENILARLFMHRIGG